MKRLSDFAPQFPNNAVCLTAGMRCEEEVMTREEAILFARCAQILAKAEGEIEAIEFYKLAESALRAQYEQEKNGPPKGVEIDPIHAAGGCYCMECERCVTGHCTKMGGASVCVDGFCNYGRRREDANG